MSTPPTDPTPARRPHRSVGGPAGAAPGVTTDRVRRHTAPRVLARLDARREADVVTHLGAPEDRIARRLAELDAEWDVERVLELNASTLMITGVVLSRTRSPRWLLLSTAVPAFLLQHAVQGWCPPIALLRRLGLRTRGEIDAERTALKAARGDFAGLDCDTAAAGAEEAHARRLLDAAVRR